MFCKFTNFASLWILIFVFLIYSDGSYSTLLKETEKSIINKALTIVQRLQKLNRQGKINHFTPLFSIGLSSVCIIAWKRLIASNTIGTKNMLYKSTIVFPSPAYSSDTKERSTASQSRLTSPQWKRLLMDWNGVRYSRYTSRRLWNEMLMQKIRQIAKKAQTTSWSRLMCGRTAWTASKPTEREKPMNYLAHSEAETRCIWWLRSRAYWTFLKGKQFGQSRKYDKRWLRGREWLVLPIGLSSNSIGIEPSNPARRATISTPNSVAYIGLESQWRIRNDTPSVDYHYLEFGTIDVDFP